MNSDISAYTYERTLIMEQRNQMLRELQLNKKQSLGVVSVESGSTNGEESAYIPRVDIFIMLYTTW